MSEQKPFSESQNLKEKKDSVSSIDLSDNSKNKQTSDQIQNYKNRKSVQLENNIQQQVEKEKDKDIIITKKVTGFQKIRDQINDFLDNIYFVIIMGILTVYALFGDDIRVLVINNKYEDPYFWGVTLFCFILFLVEIILSSIAKDDYICGFFFWLDFVSTVSLIFDIGWVSDLIFSQDTSGSTQNSSQNTQDALRASRSSRIGTKAGRIVRIVRLIRLVKLYKAAHQAFEIKQQQEEEIMKNMMDLEEGGAIGGQELQKRDINTQRPSEILNRKPSLNQPEDNSENKKQLEEKKQQLNQETNVGKKLSDLTTRRVITIVMAIIISIPVFDINTYYEQKTSYEFGLQFILKRYYKYNITSVLDPTNVDMPFYKANYEVSKFTYINDNNDIRLPLIYLAIIQGEQQPHVLYLDDQINLDTMRTSQKQQYYYQDDELTKNEPAAWIINAIYNDYEDQKLNAIFSISRTLFVCIVLTSAALYFIQDATDLVLSPIEEMLQKIRKIGQNPLEAAQMEEKDALIQEEINKDKGSKQNELQTYETAILEKTIIKLGALLAIGFGEAGSEIIAKNMEKGGEVDPMIPGKKIMAIFGFCDIRSFTDCTEVLQEDVMVFVNEIAEIAHSSVDAMSGAANKNIGDAFLLVWKYPDNCVKSDPNNPSILKLVDSIVVQQLSEMAVISFLKIIATINLCKRLDKYNNHVGLNERMPNYHIQMGFGLHVGWAIEGAIGSEYKIDASYLSPNVNMSSRLEAATKQFGVPLLISGVLLKLMTPEAQAEHRRIDRVTVKGSIDPVDFYTVDCDIENLQKKIAVCEFDRENPENMTKMDKKKMKFRKRIKRNAIKKEVMRSTQPMIYRRFFIGDREIRSMRETWTTEFYQLWDKGMEFYIDGNWSEAQKIFEQTYTSSPDKHDGPSLTLLEVIKDNKGKAPASWKGVRELTEK